MARAITSSTQQKCLRNNLPSDSTRESIHAVESVLKILTNEESGDFSKALQILTPKIGLHPALKKSFDAIYGYTSDEKGIRHSSLNEPSRVTNDEALLMLSLCSGMVSYFIGRHDALFGKAS